MSAWHFKKQNGANKVTRSSKERKAKRKASRIKHKQGR